MEGLTIRLGDGHGGEAELAALQSELQFRRLLEKLPAGAYTCDAEGLITYFNQHAVALWGRAPKLGDPVDRFCGSFKLYSADGKPIAHDQCWMALALKNGAGYNGEEIIVERPGGERLTVLAHANPVHDDSGKLLGAVNVLVDISGRKQAETELQEQLRQITLVHALSTKVSRAAVLEEVYDTALDAILDATREERAAVLLFDQDEVIRFKAWRGLSGAYRAAVEGHSPWSPDQVDAVPITVPDVEADTSLGHFRDVILREGIRALAFIPLAHENRLLGKFMIYLSEPRAFSESEIRLAQTVANHVAFAIQRKQAEQALLQSEESLRQLNESLERRVAERTVELEARNRDLEHFTYAASHDLQEPLRKVHSFADLVGDEYGEVLGEAGRTYVDRIQAGTRRMSTLVQDLLSYSRVSMQARRFMRVDLNQVADEVVSDLQLRIEETGGHIEISRLPNIDADPAQMRQLFQNLIGNALKFHHPGQSPRVEISASIEQRAEASPADICCIVVKDNGIGFDQQYASRIFAPFQRLHTRTKYEGSGIGLAICQRIAERHNGSITALSHPGTGATFEVRLPVRQLLPDIRATAPALPPAAMLPQSGDPLFISPDPAVAPPPAPPLA